MPKRKQESDWLKGWQQIATFLGQPVSVAQRWAKSGMPVTRKGRYVYASPDELNRWLASETAGKPVKIRLNLPISLPNSSAGSRLFGSVAGASENPLPDGAIRLCDSDYDSFFLAKGTAYAAAGLWNVAAKALRSTRRPSPPRPSCRSFGQSMNGSRVAGTG